MKLIKQTYRFTFFWVAPILMAGSIFAFFMIKYIVYEEVDEFLTYEMNRIIAYHKINQELPDNAYGLELIPNIRYDQPVFKDTFLLETGDNEMVPYRELYFSIHHKGQDFTLVLRQLLLGSDDIITGTIIIVAGILLLIAVIIFLHIKYITTRLWKPFYDTLGILNRLNITDPVPGFPDSGIDEFETLNHTLKSLFEKIAGDYRNTKEFSENVSHELQTRLATIRANTEQLLNSGNFSEEILSKVKKVHSTVLSLQQVQKSLFLLARINNREFNNISTVRIDHILNDSIDQFRELIDMRKIRLSMNISECSLNMDPGLSQIFINNLVKNSVKHNVDGGFINVVLNADQLIIENSGTEFRADSLSLLKRFEKGRKGNMGIGLSMVHQICTINHFKMQYLISDQFHHKIAIFFKSGNESRFTTELETNVAP